MHRQNCASLQMGEKTLILSSLLKILIHVDFPLVKLEKPSREIEVNSLLDF